MRVALYARYSSDVQNERSIDDQIATLTRHAVAKGWEVVTAFLDAAISGSYMANRPGILSAVAAAERGDFDILLVEDEDRIARNLEEQTHIYNRLRHRGVAIATLSSERIGIMDVGLKGMMAELYIANLSQKTARGMRANAEQGKATGARLYGYSSAPGGALAIVEDEAQIIRRIFDRYVAGATAREIAEALNKERIPSPQRANGILHTELYAGVKVWNRLETRKDPRTGKKLSRPRPESEWRRTPVPDLRIVDEPTWQAARDRKAAEATVRPEHLVKRRPGIFSGLLRCGVCGASYTASSGGRLICTARRERGLSACSNRRTVMRAEIEARVLKALHDRMLSPEAVQTYIRAYHKAWQKKRAAELAQRAPLERRLAEVGRRIDRGVEAVFDGTANAKIKEGLASLEAEKAELVARLGAMADAEQPIDLHPRLAEAYAAKIAELQGLLARAAEDGRRPLVEAARDLVEKIEITPLSDEHAAEVEIVLHGRLAAFLRPKEGENKPLQFMGAVVAGGGIEPPTCGL
jgi:site-specific DNA recombinase